MSRDKSPDKGVVEIRHDLVNEQLILAAVLAMQEAPRAQLLSRLRPEVFAAPEHQAIWTVLREMQHRKLDYDPATLKQVGGDRVDSDYVEAISSARPAVPPNLEHHIEVLLWDHARITAARGPVSQLVQALSDPKALPERVKGYARQVAAAFDGHKSRQHLVDAEHAVLEQIADVKARMAGRAVYPYGIDGLDKWGAEEVYEQGTEWRIIPGASPGTVTVITGTSGSGKSVFAARVALELGRMRRRVLFGAWEQGTGMTLEAISCFALGWDKTKLSTGQITVEELEQLREKMRAVGRYVQFMSNPFNCKVRERASNEANLDTIHGHIADSGCEVFVADLWERCLAEDEPGDEKRALYRQQGMAEELGVHVVLVHQQRLKDVEQRRDKRPTREGMKGSAAYVEVADTIIGVHRPALYKAIDDNVIELLLLKQRYGKWPLAVEFDWDPRRGSITNGRSVPYDQVGEQSDDPIMSSSIFEGGKGRKKKGP